MQTADIVDNDTTVALLKRRASELRQLAGEEPVFMFRDDSPDSMSGIDPEESILDEISDHIGDEKVVLGFDGYVDRVRTLIGDSSNQDSSRQIESLGDLGDQISAAARAERSILLKWTAPELRAGGHVCHIARALRQLDYDPVLIGMFEQPPKNLFRNEFGDCPMISLGNPAYTDAIEFDDWKFMLSETGGMRSLRWELIRDEVGLERLAEHLDGAAAMSIGYWTVISGMASIFEGLADEVIPTLSSPPRHILIDPSNIGKRPTAELKQGAEALSHLDDLVPVTVSANQFETENIANSYRSTESNRTQMEVAAVARDQLNVSRFVSHRATNSVLVSETEQVAVGVPKTDDPMSTTGVGDYFNAGILIGLIQGLQPHEVLALGNAIAGCFVRQGDIPSYDDIESFLRSYSIRNWKQ